VELKYRNSFFRDLDNISNRELSRNLENLIIKIQEAHTIGSIPRLKKLKRTKAFEYKIELQVQTKVYWILADVYSEQLEFVRIKSEAWCKKNL